MSTAYYMKTLSTVLPSLESINISCNTRNDYFDKCPSWNVGNLE